MRPVRYNRKIVKMRLPNAENALIEKEKITEYLLNHTHRYGASKARFLASFGFYVGDWQVLAYALHEHGIRNVVTRVRDTAFGARYESRGNTDCSGWPRAARMYRLAV